MKLSIIGGGAWGTTLAQTLSDNGHQVMIYDINHKTVDTINNGIHPTFHTKLPKQIAATLSLKEVCDFSNMYVLSVPTKVVRGLLQQMNPYITQKSVFINVSKGIEPKTLKRVSEIVFEEITESLLKGYVALTGPSHAEEVVKRKITLLVSASENQALAMDIQHIFSNEQYLRVYTSNDLIGCEVGGAIKNAIAVISGAATGLQLGENARAAVITRGIVEIIRVVELMGGKRETAYGLTGVGDLIVTASSENSRNFRAGKKVGMGIPMDQIYQESTQTIEGFRTIEAMHDLALKHNIELPMIEAAYQIIFNQMHVKEALLSLLSRDLKKEQF